MQNDLFEIPMNSSVNLGLKQASEKAAFLDRYRMNLRLDQALAGTIVLIMIYVLVFSFGVEKGKRFAMEELRSERTKRDHMVQELREKLIQNGVMPAGEVNAINLNKPVSLVVAAPVAAPQPAVSVPAAALPAKAAAAPTAPTALAPQPKAAAVIPSGKYTIQLVTYKSQASAEKGAQELLKKGLKGFVLQKGSYWELCAQSYDGFSKAKEGLKELKDKALVPADAFIRTLS